MADQCRKLGSYGWIIKTAAATPFRIGTAPIDLTAYTIESVSIAATMWSKWPPADL